jgi:glyoxylase-like metal-dependent hydrolase (beta-lactamase superfamily II)
MTVLEQVTPSASRLLAPNPSPMTLDGTNTWILRNSREPECVVVDPGPLDEGHLDRIVAAGPVALIVLTHSHLDHAEAAPRLAERTGAAVVARDPAWCRDAPVLQPGRYDAIAGVDWLTILTPGHSSDSVCLLLPQDRALLTGDTILGRGTTVVAHPDGRLADYLDSLHRLRDLADTEVDALLPGHGAVVENPLVVLDFYLSHRQERLDQVRAALAAGDTTAKDVVRRVYAEIDPALWHAAELSVQAQLDYLKAN